MFRTVTFSAIALALGAIAGAQNSAAAPPATCIGKHCAIFAPAASPAVAIIVAKGIGAVLHPAVGVYCVSPAVKFGMPPFVPLVSILASMPPGPAPGTFVKFAEINFGGLALPGCPVVDPPGAPFIEVDTSMVPPGGPIFAIPSDAVGFLLQF